MGERRGSGRREETRRGCGRGGGRRHGEEEGLQLRRPAKSRRGRQEVEVREVRRWRSEDAAALASPLPAPLLSSAAAMACSPSIRSSPHKWFISIVFGRVRCP